MFRVQSTQYSCSAQRGPCTLEPTALLVTLWGRPRQPQGPGRCLRESLRGGPPQQTPCGAPSLLPGRIPTVASLTSVTLSGQNWRIIKWHQGHQGAIAINPSPALEQGEDTGHSLP